MGGALTAHRFRIFTRLVVLAGIVASLSLMFYAGRNNQSILLMSMFTAWVVSPFMVLLAASQVSAKWKDKHQVVLNLIMLVVPALSVLAYGGKVSPAGTRPAFMFLVIPLASWLLFVTLYLAARRKEDHSGANPGQSIPLWITIASALIAALALFVGGSLYVSPGSFIPDIDFSQPHTQFLVHMWASRQVAIASAIFFSLLRKSPPMLLVSLGAYCLMNLQDVWIGISLADGGLAVGAGFFATLSGNMVFVLARRQASKEKE
jgi:hypothetical protein